MKKSSALSAKNAQQRVKHIHAIWDAAISAVSGATAVKSAIAIDEPFAPDFIISVGKAAVGMCMGALENYSEPCKALVITKHGHSDMVINSLPHVSVMEASHPVPDTTSLEAGATLLNAVISMPEESRLLLLVSGGASALAEVLVEGVGLDDLQLRTESMLAMGRTIEQINAARKTSSMVKGAMLLKNFQGAEARVYAISDVQGDSIATIGSGLGDCSLCRQKCRSSIIASNFSARKNAENQARQFELVIRRNEETLYGDVFDVAERIGRTLTEGEPGVYIWGGEPTITLPSAPGTGGRAQSLALAVAEKILGYDNITVLAAGTDGTDGPTNAAGGLVDGATFSEVDAARTALKKADAGTYLAEKENLWVTGPTQTNVMDLVIAVVS